MSWKFKTEFYKKQKKNHKDCALFCINIYSTCIEEEGNNSEEL